MSSRDETLKTVMVMGSPRSGTTWLGKIFDSHPDTIYSHEPDSSRPLDEIPLLIPLSKIERYRAALLDQVAELREIRSGRVVGKLPLFPKSYYPVLGYRTRCLLVAAMKAGSRHLANLSVPDLFDRSHVPHLTWIWKSIESVGRLGALARVIDRSRVILIVRHPCGVISSVLRGQAGSRFGSKVQASEDYGLFEMLSGTEPAKKRGLTIERFRAMSPIERIAWRWALVNEKAMQDISGLANCKLLRYEDLCADPVAESKQLLAFTELRWNEQTEKFVRRSTEREIASYYSIYKNPLRAAMKWRSELSAGDVERILSFVKDTLPGRLFLDKPLPE